LVRVSWTLLRYYPYSYQPNRALGCSATIVSIQRSYLRFFFHVSLYGWMGALVESRRGQVVSTHLALVAENEHETPLLQLCGKLPSQAHRVWGSSFGPDLGCGSSACPVDKRPSVE
jgi:hypothetical protein